MRQGLDFVNWLWLQRKYTKFNQFQASAYASDDGVLTPKMISDNTKEYVKQHMRKMDWLAAERTKASSGLTSGAMPPIQRI